jgi:squalene synthase HpnC
METIREEIPSLSSPASTNPNAQLQLSSTDPGNQQSAPQASALGQGEPQPQQESPPQQKTQDQTATRNPHRQAARSGVGRVRADLERFGPGKTIPPLAIDEAFAYCRELAQAHYENFSVATRLVPTSVRPHLASIYAYCRWSDDLADEMEDPATATQLLDWWRGQLDACFAGQATHPVFIALRQTIAQYRLKPEPFTDLLSAFLQDQSQTNYESDSELVKYCERSANPVGRLVTQLARLSSTQAIAWSDSICTGLQLANLCQDIRLDAQRGRVYWPLERLQSLGIETKSLTLDSPGAAACRGVMDWTHVARRYLCDGLPLVQQGPLWFARSVQMFARGGLLILRNIDSQGGDVWSRSVTVSKVQKLQLMVRAILFPRSTAIPACDQPRLDA